MLGTMFCSVRTISQFDRRALEVGPAYASPMDFSNTVINAAAGQTAIMHNLRGINSTISTGTTSGLQAISYATEVIRSGRARAVLAGGADEMCFESFYGFDRAGLLCRSDQCEGDFPIPFDKRRNGFALGEGAAFLMLENATFARQRGAHVLGRDHWPWIAVMTVRKGKTNKLADRGNRLIDSTCASRCFHRTSRNRLFQCVCQWELCGRPS